MAYNIVFYETDNQKSNVWDFLEQLRVKSLKNKDARIQYRQAILYFFCEKDNFVLLHTFRKKTKKTPRREIEKAKLERDDYLKRREIKK